MPLSDDDMPALFRAADQASAKAQNTYLLLLKVQAIALVVAAVGGAVTAVAFEVDLAGLVAVLAFATAGLASIYLGKWDLAGAWYEARAVAESTKTLAWCYSVGGAPFAESEDLDEADALLVQRLGGLLVDLKHAASIQQDGGLNITPAMRALRDSSLGSRRDTYLRDRVEAQRSWYTSKAAWNATQARRWFGAMLLLQAFGLAGGVAKATQVIEVDLLGVLAALAAVAASWTKVKQHESLATAYGLTANELAMVLGSAPAPGDEVAWVQFVQDAEEAVSREHTMWKASRGRP